MVSRKIFILFLGVFVSILLFSSNIFADKVIIQQNNGFLISSPQQDYLEKGENHLFNFHLSRLDSGELVTDSETICIFTLYDDKGQILLFQNASYNNDGTNNWNVNVSGNNFTRIGEYDYYVSCQDELNKLGGVRSEEFFVTPTGRFPLDTSDSLVTSFSVLIIFLVAGFFFILSSRVNNPMAKIAFLILASIFLIIAVFYGMVAVQQTLYGYDELVEGFSTFFMVLKILIGISITSLLIVSLLMAIRFWKIKRGVLD